MINITNCPKYEKQTAESVSITSDYGHYSTAVTNRFIVIVLGGQWEVTKLQ